jgi:hypothetical protein
LSKWKKIGRRSAGEHNCIGAMKRSERFAEASRRQQAIAGIVGSDQNDIEVAGKGTVLKAIVEQMELGSELLLGKNSGSTTGFPDDNRNIQAPGHKQRFVAEIIRRSGWVDQEYATCLASETTRENIEFQAARFKQLSQQKYKRCFAGSSDGEVANAHHRATESLGADDAVVIEQVPGANPESENGA